MLQQAYGEDCLSRTQCHENSSVGERQVCIQCVVTPLSCKRSEMYSRDFLQ